MNRMLVLSVLFALGFGAAAAAETLDGTWAGGWETGDGVQIIVVGDRVIGFYRGDDYLTVERSVSVPGGGAIDFTWPSGEAVLARDAKGEVRVTIRAKGKTEEIIPVKRD